MCSCCCPDHRHYRVVVVVVVVVLVGLFSCSTAKGLKIVRLKVHMTIASPMSLTQFRLNLDCFLTCNISDNIF